MLNSLSKCVELAIEQDIPLVRNYFCKEQADGKMAYCINGLFCRFNGYSESWDGRENNVGSYNIYQFTQDNPDKVEWHHDTASTMDKDEGMTVDQVITSFDLILKQHGKASITQLMWLNNHANWTKEQYRDFLKERGL